MDKHTDRQAQWANRIVGEAELSPADIAAHPLNWRLHPNAQQAALSGVLSEVGWVQRCIINQRTGRLVDGHLRVSLALREGVATVPVLYVDLDEREEALVLATLDPIAAMAGADAERLAALLEGVSTGDAAVQAMLGDIAARAGIGGDDVDPWQGMPEWAPADTNETSIAVHFASQERRAEFGLLLGQPVTEHTRWLWFPAEDQPGGRDINNRVVVDES